MSLLKVQKDHQQSKNVSLVARIAKVVVAVPVNKIASLILDYFSNALNRMDEEEGDEEQCYYHHKYNHLLVLLTIVKRSSLVNSCSI